MWGGGVYKLTNDKLIKLGYKVIVTILNYC